MSARIAHYLVGCGSVLESIAAEPQAYVPDVDWYVRKAESVASLSSMSGELLTGIEASTSRVFVAVDSQALNYARLELYGVARMLGLKMMTLLHPTAWRAPHVRLADNVWLGPGVQVARGCHIESDVLVNAGARLDEDVRIGAHGWVGPGTALGARTQVGNHSAIGTDVKLRADLKIGRHCTLDRAGPWMHNLADGSFAEPEIPGVAHVLGAGYSFKKEA